MMEHCLQTETAYFILFVRHVRLTHKSASCVAWAHNHSLQVTSPGVGSSREAREAWDEGGREGGRACDAEA